MPKTDQPAIEMMGLFEKAGRCSLRHEVLEGSVRAVGEREGKLVLVVDVTEDSFLEWLSRLEEGSIDIEVE
jgi:hypothetical protein